MRSVDRSLLNLIQHSPKPNQNSPESPLKSYISQVFRFDTPIQGQKERFQSPPPMHRSFLTDTPSPTNLIPAMRRLQTMKHGPKISLKTESRKEEFKYQTLLQDLEDAKQAMTVHFKDLKSLQTYVEDLKSSIDRGKVRSRRLVRRIFKRKDVVLPRLKTPALCYNQYIKMAIVPTRPTETEKNRFGLSFFIREFNQELKKKHNGLPADYPEDQLYTDPKLYYKKLNSIYLRRKARELMAVTPTWTLEDVFAFFRYVLWKCKDQTFRTSAMYFMMYRYHEISADVGIIDVWRQWVRNGEIQPPKMLDDFAEYCLLPLLNFSGEWRTALLDWADDEDKWVRRCAGVSVKKCAIDKDKVPFVFELCLKLLKHCAEPEVQSGIGQALLKVGKKRRHLLIPFLDEHYSIMPKMTLRMALTRLSNKDKEHYMTKLDLHTVTQKEKQRTSASFFNPEAIKMSFRTLSLPPP